MEHIGRQPSLRILLVGLPVWLGEMVTELIEADTKSLSVSTTGVLEAEVELTTAHYDLVIAELMVTGLPTGLERFRARDQHVPMLGIGDSRAVLYVEDTPPFDLGDRSLREIVAEARKATFALQERRSK